MEHQLEEERQLSYSFDKSTNDRENFDVQEASYTSDSVNTDQYQKEEKKPEVQPKDISESQQDEKSQQQDDSFNQNDKDIAIEETQTKKASGVVCLVANDCLKNILNKHYKLSRL